MSNRKILQIAGSWRTYIVLGLGYLLVAACTPQPRTIPITGDGQTPEAESDLANTKWMLVSFVQSGAETPVIVGSSITLEFGSQRQAGGSGGCNSYGAQYRVQDNLISFGEITRTLMACGQGGIGEQEQRYFRALESTGTFELAGDRLTIWCGDRGDKLNFVVAAIITPTAPSTAPSGSTPTAPLAPTPTAGTGSSRERVEFEPDATSATRSGVLREGGVKEYVLWALAGQIIHVQTVGQSAPVYFTLRSPSGTIWSGESQPSDVYIFTAQVILPESGDYVVRLSVPQDARATYYDVGFTIPASSPPSSNPPPVVSPERVNFPPGATSATRSGDLPISGVRVKEYALWAAAGQTMYIQTVGYSAPVDFTLTSPNGETWFGEPQPSIVYSYAVQVILPQNGDYVARLFIPSDAGTTRYDVTFTLSAISQPPTPPVGSPERVNFPPGATSATRSGDLPAGGIKEYVLWAAAGQSMHVQTVGYNAPVEFTVTSPSGETWSGELQPSDVYIFTVQVTLPQNGDYLVRLSVPPGITGTHYDVTFTITSPRGIQ